MAKGKMQMEETRNLRIKSQGAYHFFRRSEKRQNDKRNCKEKPGIGEKPGEGVWCLRNQVKKVFPEACNNCVKSYKVK